MCRSIKTLRRADARPEDEAITAAALQFVRKISGYHSPSRANADRFNAAVDEISAASRRLLNGLVSRQPLSGRGDGRPGPRSGSPSRS